MHIRFLSEEYLGRDFTGKQYCIDNGVELYYHKRRHTFSSSDLRKRTYELEFKRMQQVENEPAIEQHSTQLLEKYMGEFIKKSER